MSFFGSHGSIIVDFPHDDQHVEYRAYLISELRPSLALLCDEPADLLITKTLEYLFNEPLLDIVLSELNTLVELFRLKVSFRHIVLLFLFNLLLEDSEFLSLRLE